MPASGYFEWKGDAGAKQPYFIHDPAGDLLMFAGPWERSKPADNAERLHTFTIITGEADKVIGDIDDRAPVILSSKSWQEWLTDGPGVAAQVLQHAPEVALAYHAVTKAVGSPRNKGPEMVEAIKLHPPAIVQRLQARVRAHHKPRPASFPCHFTQA